MADRQLIICEPLCFLVNKLTSLPSFTLKSVIEDFYDADAISEAKTRLMDDVCTSFDDDDVIPHVPRRRSGANKRATEIDDILLILTTLDEKKLLDVLPRYVISSPDKIPSLRLFDGDMKLILDKMHKFDNGVQNVNSRLSVVMSELAVIRQYTNKVQTTESCRSLASNSGVTMNTSQTHHTQHQPMFVPTSMPVPGPSSQVSTSLRNSVSTPNNDVLAAHTGLLGNSINWAAQMHTDTDTDTDTGFTVVRGKKRQRGSPRTVLKHPEGTSATAQSGQHRRRRNVIGKQIVTDNNIPIKAAKQIIKKSIFCIDNVDLSVSADTLSDYIKTKKIDVMSVYEVNPRRRRNETTVTDRRAFRVCIAHSDQDKLLDESTWPSSVIISDWYHKPRATTAQTVSDNQQLQQHAEPSTENNDMDATVTAITPTTA